MAEANSLVHVHTSTRSETFTPL